MEEKIITTDHIINNNITDLATYIAKGEFEQAVNLLSAHPETFSSFIKITGENITRSKTEAEEVRDRKFFERLFASNSKDIAKIILKQNSTLANFFIMLQLLTLSAKGNVMLLTDLCQAIKKNSSVGDVEQENINKLAIAFLEQNIDSIKEGELRDTALKKLLKGYDDIKQSEINLAALVDKLETEKETFKEEIEDRLKENSRQNEEFVESFTGKKINEKLLEVTSRIDIAQTKDESDKNNINYKLESLEHKTKKLGIAVIALFIIIIALSICYLFI